MTTFVDDVEEFIVQGEELLDNFPIPSETITLSESVPVIGTFNHTNSEAITVLDAFTLGWEFIIADSGTAADTILGEIGVLLQEVIALTEEVLASGTYNPVLAELVSTLDTVLDTRLFQDTLTESPVAADVIVNEFFILKNLIEIISFNETVAPSGDTSASLIDTISVIDSVLRAFLESLSDTITGAETLVTLLTISGLIADSASSLETVSNVAFLNHLINEVPEVSDTTSNIGSFFEVVIDSSEISSKLTLDGEVFQCWILTTDEFKLSSYTNFEFNSFATVQGMLFGAKETGVYLIDKDSSDDDGTAINSGVQFNFEALTDLHKKRFRKAYIGASGTNMILKVEDHDNNARYYSLSRKQVTIGKDLQNRRYRFALKSITEIDHIEFYPILLDKNR